MTKRDTSKVDEINATNALAQIDELLGMLGNLSDGAAWLLGDRLERIHASVQIGGDELELRDDSHTLLDLEVLDGVRRFLGQQRPEVVVFLEDDDAIALAIQGRDREAFFAKARAVEKRLTASQREAIRSGRIYREPTRARLSELGIVSSTMWQTLERPRHWIFSLTKLGMEIARMLRHPLSSKGASRGAGR